MQFSFHFALQQNAEEFEDSRKVYEVRDQNLALFMREIVT
jgi:hypothetical protein